ncbi:MAG: tRNA (adenosine(37)-N6)-dimethylallyltransferase MiaA [Opitutales bacterium]
MAPVLHIITGPTAVGKTEYALRYAERIGAAIVSADALLVYRGMDIGTAKPTAAERERVPHHLIDVSPADRCYDITCYHRDAHAAVEAITAAGKPVVVAGGSGFYLKSFFAPVVDSVKVPARVREEADALFESQGLEGALTVLHERNPGGLGNLDVRNPRRVRRALERCMASGRSLLELQAAMAARPEPYGAFEKRLVLLEREPGDLKERIGRRVERMLEAGLVDEVRGLRELGFERNPSVAGAIGYRETLAYLRGELEQEALAPTIAQNTVRLVKKQRTWFRTQLREPDERVSADAHFFG